MVIKIKTKDEYKKAVYEIAKDQVEFAKLLTYYNPDGKYKSIHRRIQKKISGESAINNNDVAIINMLYDLKENNALPDLKEIKK